MTNGEVVNTKKNANLSEKRGLLWLWKNRLSITEMSNNMAETLIKSQRCNYKKNKYLTEKGCKNESKLIQKTIWGRNTLKKNTFEKLMLEYVRKKQKAKKVFNRIQKK